MAEEQQGQEKTEEATTRKLEKSKTEGQVARSRELNSVAIVTFGALAAIALAPQMALDVQSITRTTFRLAASNLPPQTYLGDIVIQAFMSVLPLIVVMFVAGIGSSVGVGGLVLSTKSLQPKMNRMSPLKGFGRMFSSKALMELGKSLAKFILIAGVAISTLGVLLEDILFLSSKPLEVAIAEGFTYVAWSLLIIGSALIMVAAIDVPFQIAQHKKQLKMTKQEVKDEMKDSEGKPEVKAKIRSLQQQASQRKMMEQVPEADVIITNPEHFSVAIKYDATHMAAPMLVAKGVDLMAFKIREIAQAHDIPMVAVPVLARAIYHNAEWGDEVPESLYMATAQVLAYIYQLEQYRRGQTTTVPHMGSIDVPESMQEKQ